MMFEDLFWIDTNNPSDGRNLDAWRIANLSFIIHFDTIGSFSKKTINFLKDVIKKMTEWPFYCKNCSYGQKVYFKKYKKKFFLF